MNKEKLNPEVYIKAAKDLRKYHGFSCAAVTWSAGDMNEVGYVHADAYTDLFFPPDELNPEVWCLNYAWGEMWGRTNEKRNECRVLALLFMAAIAESGDH